VTAKLKGINRCDQRYKDLRHCCVVNLARAGCTPPELATITGTKIRTLVDMLKVSVPRNLAKGGRRAGHASPQRERPDLRRKGATWLLYDVRWPLSGLAESGHQRLWTTSSHSILSSKLPRMFLAASRSPARRRD
jgi:hypothetical protein